MIPLSFRPSRGVLALLVAAGVASILTPHAGRSMSVLPPTFSELVAESARIVHGRVTAVEAFRVEAPDGRALIKTRVTWLVARTLKGADTETVSLEFLGGKIGNDELRISGMPHFAVGDDDFLFVELDERVICPLIAAGHGRYRVRVDEATGRPFVARQNGLPLADVAQVAIPLDEKYAAAPGTALAPDDFAQQVLATLAQQKGGSHVQ
jgi:hypothetical protein